MDVPSTSSVSKWQTDWSCCLCQLVKKEELKSPPISYTAKQDGYTNIAMNVPLFQAMNALPIILDPARLDEGGGIERKNSAKYHQSCRLMFNNSKLQRAQKRALSASDLQDESADTRKIPRRRISPSRSECFLCEKTGQTSELRHAMTQQLNDRVNECALTLSDGKLLAKGDGGAIGVTEDPSALRRWMVAGPEVSRLVADYEIASGTKEATKVFSHHERTIQAQRAFLDKVHRLTIVLHDMGNPFQEESSDLLTLDTKDIAHTCVHDLLSTHYETGFVHFCKD